MRGRFIGCTCPDIVARCRVVTQRGSLTHRQMASRMRTRTVLSAGSRADATATTIRIAASERSWARLTLRVTSPFGNENGCPRDGHPLAGSHPDQVDLELGEGGEDVEEQLPHRVVGVVDLTAERHSGQRRPRTSSTDVRLSDKSRPATMECSDWASKCAGRTDRSNRVGGSRDVRHRLERRRQLRCAL